MGWGDCGDDQFGRPIGYLFEGVCDHSGCNKTIHRGLAYVCGDMHGDNEAGCGKYFCYDHLTYIEYNDRSYQVCFECAEELGITLDEVAIRNIDKLADRRERNVVKGEGDNR